MSDNLTVIHTSILLVLSVCGFPISIMPLVVIFGRKISSNMLYPIFLSITNIFGCIVILVYNSIDTNAKKWALGIVGCQAYQGLAYFICITNLLIFAMIAIDRYFGVLHSKVFTTRQVLGIISAITVWGLLFSALPPIIAPDSVGLQSSKVYCVTAYWSRSNQMVQFLFWYTLVIILIGLAILLFCYYSIWKKYQKVVDQITGATKSQKKEKGIVVGSIINSCSFLLLYTPYLTKVTVPNEDSL